MTHLPYIVAAYALALLIPAGFALSAASRLSNVERRLAALDTRRRRLEQQGIGAPGR